MELLIWVHDGQEDQRSCCNIPLLLLPSYTSVTRSNSKNRQVLEWIRTTLAELAMKVSSPVVRWRLRFCVFCSVVYSGFSDCFTVPPTAVFPIVLRASDPLLFSRLSTYHPQKVRSSNPRSADHFSESGSTIHCSPTEGYAREVPEPAASIALLYLWSRDSIGRTMKFIRND